MRTQFMVLAFCLVDALFMVGHAAHGALPAVVVVAFGAAGCGLTAVFAILLRMGLHRRLGGARFTTV